MNLTFGSGCQVLDFNGIVTADALVLLLVLRRCNLYTYHLMPDDARVPAAPRQPRFADGAVSFVPYE